MTPKSDPLIGTTLGSYEITEAIGVGGMARIYKGFHTELSRYAAIKVVNWGLQEDPEFTERFRREAQAIAKLRQANIVQIFDFGKYTNGYYMAMEFIDGRDLSLVLDQTKKEGRLLPKEQVIKIVKDVAGALDHAHQQGVIHRDVKPSNIMINQTGQAILTDFGLVMLSATKSQATLGGTFGTPHYIAPEQAISSAAAVTASDIYALGVILYEMVTNQLLFDDESPLSVALKHISDPPTPPTVINPNLPRAVEDVILTALAKDSADRFPTASEMGSALEAAWLGLVVDEVDSLDVISPILPAGVPAPAEVSNITLPNSASGPPSSPNESEAAAEKTKRKPPVLMWALAGSLGVSLLLLLGAVFWFSGVGGASPTMTPLPPTNNVADNSSAFNVPIATVTASSTATARPTSTATPTVTPTASPTATPTKTPPPTNTLTSTASPTPTETRTATATTAPTLTQTPTSSPPTPLPEVDNGAVTVDQLKGKILFKTDRSGPTEIYQMNADGSNQQPLPPDTWSIYADLEARLPFSPNGQEQVVTRGAGQLDLWRVSLTGGQELRITSTDGAEYDVAWSPVDNRIVFVSEETGRGDIYLINLDGSATVRLTNNVEDFDKHPTWSPDGSKVAFWSDMGFNNSRQIWQIDLESGALTSLSDNPFNDWDPVWVP